jgi:hypothetical protein
MDRQQAELCAMQMLGEARANICRAAMMPMVKKGRRWRRRQETEQDRRRKSELLRQARASLDGVWKILWETPLDPGEIGTKKEELERLRRMAAGDLTFSVPAPRPRSMSCPDPFPR